MTDLDDLIARLRARKILHVESDGYQWREPVNPDGDEAAAALEALRAENERLRKAAERALKEAVADDFDEWFADLRAAVTPR